MKYKTLSKNKSFVLVVLDSLDQGVYSLGFAANYCRQTGQAIALLQVVNDNAVPFMPWAGVDDAIKNSEAHDAEDRLAHAKKHADNLGVDIEILFYNGNEIDMVKSVLAEFDNITSLVLECDAKAPSSNVLVDYFTKNGLSALSCPLIITPTHIDFSN